MEDSIRIHVKDNTIDQLYHKYGEDAAKKAIRLVSKFTEMVERDAKKNIKEAGQIDTGRTRNAIKNSTLVYFNRIVGQVYAGTKYARFLHEGAEHEEDETIIPHFVPFSVAPSLAAWAIRHKVIEQRKGKWVLAKSGKSINIHRGGLRVKTEPSKFMEKAVESNKEQFFQEAERLIK